MSDYGSMAVGAFDKDGSRSLKPKQQKALSEICGINENEIRSTITAVMDAKIITEAETEDEGLHGIFCDRLEEVVEELKGNPTITVKDEEALRAYVLEEMIHSLKATYAGIRNSQKRMKERVVPENYNGYPIIDGPHKPF